jgi:hypothetical protein
MGTINTLIVRQRENIVGQNITIGAASVASTAFDPYTQYIQISAIGGNCHVKLAGTPVALATDMLIKATDMPMILRVGNGEKIAVIQDGASTGTLNIVEVTH